MWKRSEQTSGRTDRRMEGKTSDMFDVWVEITDAMCNDTQVLYGRTLADTWVIIYDYRVKKVK